MHEAAGFPSAELRPVTLRAAMAGWVNRDEEEGRKKKVRQAVTLHHMEMMKLLLKENKPGWMLYHRRLMMTIGCIAFWGALR